MGFRCPGQDTRKLTISLVACPECGYKVEIFSDEIRTRCPKCKAQVDKEQMPSCLQWCKSARQCIGETRWREIFKQVEKQEEVES